MLAITRKFIRKKLIFNQDSENSPILPSFLPAALSFSRFHIYFIGYYASSCSVLNCSCFLTLHCLKDRIA